MKKKVLVPSYILHTSASVTKVTNCENKSKKKRTRKAGLSEVIFEDNKTSQQKMRDIKKIAGNIDKVITIEQQR